MGFLDRFIYYPMRYPQGDWRDLSRAGAEERWLKARDGTRLNAWWYPQPGGRLATLFLHGNAGNVTHRIDHAQMIRKAGSSVLVLDYRGYGKSDGNPRESGLYMDADAGYADLQSLGYAPESIVLHGESLGTAVAVETAVRHRCGGLILEAPLLSASRMAGTVLPILGPLVVHGFDTSSKIGRVHVPVLIIHGEVDDIVPFSQGQAVFRAANEPKQFWAVKRAHHNDLLQWAAPEYVDRLRAFYRTLR